MKLGTDPIFWRFAAAFALWAAALGAWAQGRLPPCPGAYAANKWTNCVGTNMTNTGDVYSGEWVNDKFEGFGVYRYRNGTKYAGQFRASRRNGKGTYTWPDGATFVGEYKDDVRNGPGTFTFPNGAKFVGEYRNDRRNGPGTEYTPDGKVAARGIWQDDVLVKRQ